MSRIGNKPITVLTGVEVIINGQDIQVKGPKGTLNMKAHDKIQIAINEGIVEVKRNSDKNEDKALHGLTRTLINNMIIGVSEGFKKELDVNGVGYRATKQGNKLVMNLGYSHQVIMDPPEGITVDVPSPNKIIVNGSNKENVGQFAAEIRSKRLPEPYKGKGIKYADERIIRKEGKTGKK